MVIWFASGNAHKKKELEAILNRIRGGSIPPAAHTVAPLPPLRVDTPRNAPQPSPVTVMIPAEAGIPFDPEETGATFLENALLKACALYRLLTECGAEESGGNAPVVIAGGNVPVVIADDSGLCVDALDGRPGIRSARYGAGCGAENGKKLEPFERNALLLRELGDRANRKARFVCAMVLLLSPGRFYAVQETLEGELIREPRGAGGFGYDPILYLPEKNLTVAELSEAEKNSMSHRGKAARAIARLLFDGED
jgi:XTP/dITP diphosphohydrolase